jgi:hypothetical protein
MAKKTLRTFLFGTRPADLQVPAANITDELGQGAVAFGAILESVGAGVAASQQQLNDMSAEVATAFAETAVTAVVAQEEIYDENGTLVGAKSYMSQLPLINFMDVPIYEWTNVRLTGSFTTQEQTTATQTNRTDLHLDASGSGGKGKKAKFTLNIKASNTNIGTSSSTDVSVAQVRMAAVLEPRQRMTVSRPVVTTHSPQIELLAGPIDPQAASRTLTVTLTYKRVEGDQTTLIQGVPISIETSGLTWALVSPSGTDVKTGSDGKIVFVLRRNFPDGDGLTAPPGSFGVAARVGLVSANLSFIM